MWVSANVPTPAGAVMFARRPNVQSEKKKCVSPNVQSAKKQNVGQSKCANTHVVTKICDQAKRFFVSVPESSLQ